MLTLPNCNVITQDDIFQPIESGALVVVTGETPNATVRLALPDYESKKFLTLDTLTRASYTRKGDTWTFAGRSAHLREEVGASDYNLKIQVTPEPGCSECRK